MKCRNKQETLFQRQRTLSLSFLTAGFCFSENEREYQETVKKKRGNELIIIIIPTYSKLFKLNLSQKFFVQDIQTAILRSSVPLKFLKH